MEPSREFMRWVPWVVPTRKTLAVTAIFALAACRSPSLAGPSAEAHAQKNPRPQVPSTPQPKPELVARPPAPPEARLGVDDVGIWSDLDPEVQLALPIHFNGPRTLLVDEARQIATLYDEDWPIKVYPLGGSGTLRIPGAELRLRPGDAAELQPILGPGDVVHLLPGTSPPPGDRDEDGIADPIDILLGAHKTVLNKATYDGGYVVLPYPLGDVPREQGVCTDVLVRAGRNAGLDMQREVHEAITQRPAAFRRVKKPDRSIDHRRVKTVLPYFERAWTPVPTDDLRPGDIVFFDTFPNRPGPDHVGVVSNQRNRSSRYLVINNWDVGSTPRAMDLLDGLEVTHAFRFPSRLETLPAVSQLIVVTSDGWNAPSGVLQRFERTKTDGPWIAVGKAVPIVLGAQGMAWGRGVHGSGPLLAQNGTPERGPEKREGDMRSPAGVFALGALFGIEPAAPDWQTPVSESWRCVDDPESVHYTRVLDRDAVAARDWSSAETMVRSDAMYRRALLVHHNTAGPRPGSGSCIFIHQWSGPDQAVAGCTAMAASSLDQLTDWIDPERSLLVQLPRTQYERMRKRWAFPRVDPS